MKIFAHKVVPLNKKQDPLHRSLKDHYKSKEEQHEERLYEKPDLMLRLEHFEEKKRLQYLNFALLRLRSGPGKAARNRRISDIDMDPDDFFTEETACLYDPSRRYLLVQYNHYGAKIGAISEYINWVVDPVEESHRFPPTLSEAGFKKVQNLELVKKIEMSFSLPDLENCPDAMPFHEGTHLAKAAGAQTMSLVMAHPSGLLLQPARSLLQSISSLLSSRNSQGSSAVTRVQVRGACEEDGPLETIDLLAQRLSYEVSLPRAVSTTPGRRIPLAFRWSALTEAHDDFTQRNLLI
jgi:hypothetical protein